MNPQRALDLFGGLPGRDIAQLWEAARDLPGTELRPGLWLGRNGGMPAAMKWVARRVVKRDYFAKLVFEDFGVNVRVAQDGSHALLPASDGAPGHRVDMPFALTEHGLDYGFHVLGRNSKRLQMRDYLRVIDLGEVARLAPADALAAVGVDPGEPGEGELVIGYMAPLGVERLKGTPFGMVWWRDTTAEEEAGALAWISRRRMVDSSIVLR